MAITEIGSSLLFRSLTSKRNRIRVFSAEYLVNNDNTALVVAETLQHKNNKLVSLKYVC